MFRKKNIVEYFYKICITNVIQVRFLHNLKEALIKKDYSFTKQDWVEALSKYIKSDLMNSIKKKVSISLKLCILLKVTNKYF